MTITLDPLDYYARIGAALFPIPRGSKSPVGIVASFKTDHSTDPAVWASWASANPGCNFGLVAGPSRLIIADVDVSEIGRDAAWSLWCEWWQSHGLAVPPPHTESARGGWHTLLALPPDLDISTLRQVALIGPTNGSKKAVVDLRVGNGFTVAAGSYYDGTARGESSGPYTLLTDAPPHPAPAALIEHCTRRAPTKPAGAATIPGEYDKGDVAALLAWLAERDAFTEYSEWVSVGMALRLSFHDDGFEIWEGTFDGTVDHAAALTKWESFSTEPDSHSVTLLTFIDRAKKSGWRGTVRRSSAAMFDGVAALAAMSGASLASSLPTPAGPGLPMLAAMEELCRLATPILQDFLNATTDAPTKPAAQDLPGLPSSLSGHGLFDLMQSALQRVFSLAEQPKFKAPRVIDPLAVLYVMHAEVYDAVARRFRSLGITIPERQIKLNAVNLAEQIERITVTLDKWEYDRNGEPQADNSDNVKVLLGVLGLDIRWNAWLERMEIQGGLDPELRWSRWTYVDDSIVAKLRTRANRTKTRFRPGKDFLWESLLALSHQNYIDPVLDRLADLSTRWDRVPRLATWLTTYCGVPCDPYSQAVSRAIIGGIVMRARYPGCKFDLMPIFYGHQGTGKSTAAAILADMGQSSLDALRLGAGMWFTDTVQLGDEAKELVLSLAGKLVAEIGEMGMRNGSNANAVKAMISRQVDAGRTAYARAVTERPRRNIFFGTTNDEHPLTDPSGNRRFLPVAIGAELNLEGLHRDVGQLIGEAAYQESIGRTFDLPREVWELAASRQEDARAIGDLEVYFAEWFKPGAAGYVTIADIVLLCDAVGRKGQGAVVNRIMPRLGFQRAKPYLLGHRMDVWVRGEVGRVADIERLPRFHADLSNSGAPRTVLRTVAR